MIQLMGDLSAMANRLAKWLSRRLGISRERAKLWAVGSPLQVRLAGGYTRQDRAGQSRRARARQGEASQI